MLPFTLILERPVFHIVEYCEPSSFPVSNVNFTSAPVNGFPSFHLTPERSVRTYVLPTHLPLVASQGMYLSPSGSYRKSVSYSRPTVPVERSVRSGLKLANGPQAVPEVNSVLCRGSASGDCEPAPAPPAMSAAALIATTRAATPMALRARTIELMLLLLVLPVWC